MKKGQAAMEYLMTYGWAILIVIVVIGALFAMGVFNTSSAVACSPCFSNFAFVDYSGGILMIRNGPKEIVIDNVSSTPSGATSSGSYDPGDEITITNVPTSGDVDLTITYNVTGGLGGHTDTATIHN